jgi:hypothetical protein
LKSKQKGCLFEKHFLSLSIIIKRKYMSRKKFANAFNSFINEIFNNEVPITTLEIKKALKAHPNHPIHLEYRAFLKRRNPSKGWTYKLYDYNRVANWMKSHPGFYRMLNGIKKQWGHEIKVYRNFIKIS